jgi:polysaccharide pyruvyl transferase WcaK-like protein
MSLPIPPKFEVAMLGGGTLIGTAHARMAIERLRRRQPLLPLMMLGTGVEDPGWEAAYSATVAEELGRWRPLFDAFVGGVAVRGPRSARLLADIGIEAAVVGDPALLLGEPMLPAPLDDAPTLAVNVGVARHIYGGRPEQVLEQVAGAVRMAQQRGWRVRVLPVWPEDVGYSQALCDRLGPRATLVSDAPDLDVLLPELARADAIVGMKLHSIVLAAAVGTPGIMIAYHPKCIDFQESIGRQDATIRTDQLGDGALLTVTERLLAEHETIAEQTKSAVACLRARLRAHTTTVDQLLSPDRRSS